MGQHSLDKLDKYGFAYNWVLTQHPDSAKVTVVNKTPDTFTVVKEAADKLGFTVIRKGHIGERLEIITPKNSYTYYFSTGKWAYTSECNKRHQQVACCQSFFYMVKGESAPKPDKVNKTYGITVSKGLLTPPINLEFSANDMSSAAKQAEDLGHDPLIIWRIK